MKLELRLPLNESLLTFLHEKLSLFAEGEIIEKTEKAGEGNMNVVIRVTTNQRSIILKQSRPFVNKYPHIPAPFDRITTENTFYQAIRRDSFLSEMTPSSLAFDRENQLLVLEDLGATADFSDIYQNPSRVSGPQIVELAKFLQVLHSLPIDSFPSNEAMKKLNHEHIFSVPFMENPLMDLDQVQPGLRELSRPYRFDTLLKSEIEKTGDRYLSTGKTLLHGDFYPGSWLNTANGIFVIDTEFAFRGDKEFDLGVFVAHLTMAGVARESINLVLETYGDQELDHSLLRKYTGVEILRRLFGVAQLPMAMGLEEKSKLAQTAKTIILDA